MKRYILFDLDGTLTDSREGIFNSVRYSLEKLGLPCPSYETLLRFVGPPLQDSYMRYCGMTEEEAWHAVSVFRERYEVIGWAENKAADGILDLLRLLKEQGYIMAIASSKPERSVIPIAEKFGFMQYLTAACGSDGRNESKADVIRDACRRLKIGEAEKSIPSWWEIANTMWKVQRHAALPVSVLHFLILRPPENWRHPVLPQCAKQWKS